LECDYDVNAWIEGIDQEGEGKTELPSPVKKRYFIMKNGQKLQVASLPV
jgi:hypothetical protein